MKSPEALETVYLAGGCFWGVEADLAALPGVTTTQVGYTGGTLSQPTYEQVCTGKTGHAEAVKVIFDSHLLSFPELLEFFFTHHNPQELNRQGPDIGTQYRSAIFTSTREQFKAATDYIQELTDSSRFARPIVTRVEMATEFFPAEEYHQQYLFKRGLASCHI
ncbi:MAG: peptide-methionine (S)-S-oxide reductase [Candidatus Berkelbacteria bacterium Gr01-1014_85]|uniref:Peptide methionine sulfoxide reductase MsrA n=1 Tax=Candidatus Berkelbacteria bacterium Gr01-1014_85 TaxID=2017150 RepID=A0A554JAK5_9BACT|nr:MAG: peptide-methionine (S)-S-oxide reductase [Candidatus Berkelbacteria bacterium Gr01-1014_85]